jgi:hypothetical protein
MIQSIHIRGPLKIHFCAIFCETRQHAQSHLTSGALIHSSLSLAMRTTQTAAQLGTWFRWPVCYGNTRKTFLSPQHLIPRRWQQPEFHWLQPQVWFFHGYHSDTYNDLPYLDSSVWPHSCRNLMPPRYECLLQWQQNRSKATMWLLYKIPAIWVCPRCF